MRQSIEHGTGQPLTAEHFGPLLEGKIGGHDQRLTLVSAANYLEQQLRAEFAGGDGT